MKSTYANKEQSIKIVEKYLREKIDCGELKKETYKNGSIGYENEFVEYEISPVSDVFYFRKDIVEMCQDMIFFFIIPENENQFLELVNILD